MPVHLHTPIPRTNKQVKLNQILCMCYPYNSIQHFVIRKKICITYYIKYKINSLSLVYSCTFEFVFGGRSNARAVPYTRALCSGLNLPIPKIQQVFM